MHEQMIEIEQADTEIKRVEREVRTSFGEARNKKEQARPSFANRGAEPHASHATTPSFFNTLSKQIRQDMTLSLGIFEVERR